MHKSYCLCKSVTFEVIGDLPPPTAWEADGFLCSRLQRFLGRDLLGDGMSAKLKIYVTKIIRQFLMLLTSWCLGACQTNQISRKPQDLETFQFRSAVWVNLHHYLYNESFRPEAHQESSITMSSREKRQLEKAIAFYRKQFDQRDLLFDEGLKKINNQLASKENDLNLDGLDSMDGLKSILLDVYPIYFKYFWAHQDQENKEWIENTRSLLQSHGSLIQEKLEKILQRKFGDVPYRVDVVHEANWAGAYTSSAPSHTVISSGRKTYRDLAALEMVFHETMHAGPINAVSKSLEEEFLAHKMADKEQLWHAIHFFTAGEVVRGVLKAQGIEYTPYAYKNGLFSADRNWGKYGPFLKKYWLPYMEGKDSMKIALSHIVDELASASPQNKATK